MMNYRKLKIYTLLALVFIQYYECKEQSDENSNECNKIFSYITFGDYFSSNNFPNLPDIVGNSQHSWTIGLITNSFCVSPKLVLSSDDPDIESLKIEAYISDFYKYKTKIDADKIIKSTKIYQNSFKQSFHFKIKKDQVKTYKYWQIMLEGKLDLTINEFPNYQKYVEYDNPDNDLNLFIVPDLQIAYNNSHIIDKIKKNYKDYDLQMHIGNFQDFNFENNPIENDEFFKNLDKQISSKPYIVSIDNHKIPGQREYLNYKFRMPSAKNDLEIRNNHYSYVVKNTYMIVQNLENFLKIPFANDKTNDELYFWLLEELERGKEYKFIVFLNQKPVDYQNCNAENCSYDFYQQKSIDDLVKKYNVHLILPENLENAKKTKQTYNSEILDKGIAISQKLKNNIGPFKTKNGIYQTEYDFVSKTSEDTSYFQLTIKDNSLHLKQFDSVNDKLIYQHTMYPKKKVEKREKSVTSSSSIILICVFVGLVFVAFFITFLIIRKGVKAKVNQQDVKHIMLKNRNY